MATRFTDTLFQSSEGSDFIVRKWKWPIVEILLICVLVLIIVVVGYLTTLHGINGKMLWLVSLIVVAALTWLIVTHATRDRDVVMATEFQNSMLASATQLGTRFCLITKRDGAIVYIDPGFQKFFPHFMQSSQYSIDTLLDNEGIPQDIKRKILQVLEDNQSDRVILPLKDDKGNPQSMMITIDLLPRPKGYFLFRGRDFVEKRNTPKADGTNPGALLLKQAVQSLPQGIFVADETNMVTFANRTLEEWLGYGEGEITAASMKLNQLCYQYGAGEIGAPFFDNFNGKLTLQRKNRTLIVFDANQTLTKQNGQPVGVSIMVVPVSEDTKK